MLSFGFPPIASPLAHTLVLGSLPGRVSLARDEYYANPQNAFWKIVAVRIPGLPARYTDRAAVLTDCGIALWDVLAAATRTGSLDAAISRDAIANNFRAFLHIHTGIRRICFNGTTAAKLYTQHVLPTLTEPQRNIPRLTLPSTSSAHASLNFAAKLARWSVIWDYVPNAALGR